MGKVSISCSGDDSRIEAAKRLKERFLRREEELAEEVERMSEKDPKLARAARAALFASHG